EAYLIADYERRNFSLSQVNWHGGDQNIVAIRSINDTSESASGGGERNSISSGAIAGIVVGALALVAIAALAIFLVRRKKRRQARKVEGLANTEVNAKHDYEDEKKLPPQLDGFEFPRHEADAVGSQRYEMSGAPATPLMTEVDGDNTQCSELDTFGKPVELGTGQAGSHVYDLPGDDVSEMHTADLGPRIKISGPDGGTLRWKAC
ncbi:hypothetical protein LTS18_014043, partial [Coniosporium uncinatum]